MRTWDVTSDEIMDLLRDAHENEDTELVRDCERALGIGPHAESSSAWERCAERVVRNWQLEHAGDPPCPYCGERGYAPVLYRDEDAQAGPQEDVMCQGCYPDP